MGAYPNVSALRNYVHFWMTAKKSPIEGTLLAEKALAVKRTSYMTKELR